MGENTKIEWADKTFNPWLGCTKVSPACDHCYAETWAKRTGQANLWSGDRRRTGAANWQQPHKWNFDAFALKTRYRVFCASLADVFDNQVPDAWRNDLWSVIEQTPYLDWLLLTKRPQNIAKMLPAADWHKPWGDGWDNVWLGTTAENQEEADRRIPHLLGLPAKIHFLSVEPLLGPIDLYNGDPDPRLGGHETTKTFLGDWWEPGDDPKGPSRHGLDWVIVGGESGAGARPMHPDWARSLRDQCQAAEVPYFFKQHGEFREWDSGSPAAVEIDNSSDTADAILASAVRPSWVDQSGRHFTKRADLPGDETPCRLIERVGKKAAGRLLDGRTWDEVPA